MDKELIERLAREADKHGGFHGPRARDERFAALVAEECAKLADHKSSDWHQHDGKYACEDVANGIRAKFKEGV